jgi:hypothetical protein
MDPLIRGQFVNWLGSRASDGGPWAATVSFVNPHDIAWYPRFTRGVEGEANPSSVYRHLPSNFETAQGRAARDKPEMQRRAQQIANELFGEVPTNRHTPRLWTKLLDTYLLVQHLVDIEINHVLTALNKSPFADNTIVVFTSDHGEYGGAHGMRGKGFAFYDEGCRVPLIVKDPTGAWTPQAGAERRQLLSSVDLAPLMLTLATGGSAWRGDSSYTQIASRPDIAAICQNASTPGRAYIAHATDEPGTSPAVPSPQQVKPAPFHITGVRTPHGKIGRYAFWKDGGTTIDESQPVHWEAYNYATRDGRLEVDNIYDRKGASSSDKALVRRLSALLDKAMTEEIQAPLPTPLQSVQQQAYVDWFSQPPGIFTRETDN